MKYQFIDTWRDLAPLTVLCSVLSASPHGYHDWRRRPMSPHRADDAVLTKAVAAIHVRFRKTYGSPRIHRELRAQGKRVSRKRVARLMRELGIRVTAPKRFVVTTDSKHDLPIAENLLKQDFSANGPNAKWVTDITYIDTDEGWLYLSAIEDLYSRRIVGWAMDAHMETSLVLRALDMALENRRPGAGLTHHSDRGCQYASHAYRTALNDHGIGISMSRRGNCYDNACIESFWKTLKVELVYRGHFRTRDEAKAAIFEYIEVFYNRIRSHSALDYVSPAAFELAHRTQKSS